MKEMTQTLILLDNALFIRLFGLQLNKLITTLIYCVSKSADGIFYFLIPILAWLIGHENANDFLIFGLTAFAIELPLYKILKNSIKRKRPFKVLNGVTRRINPPDQFSFPSGHTSGAFVIYVLVAHFFLILSLPVLLWASLVGFSRVHLGVHFPLDVIIGAFVGFFCGNLTMLLV
jgi:undecaprenyl-diphosphatase